MVEVGRSLEGESLGPYRLEQFVGGGGMGVVFRALDTTLNRIVAVKVLLRQQSADEEMLKRFQNEAQSAARLDHENIGRVHAVGSDNGLTPLMSPSRLPRRLNMPRSEMWCTATSSLQTSSSLRQVEPGSSTWDWLVCIKLPTTKTSPSAA